MVPKPQEGVYYPLILRSRPSEEYIGVDMPSPPHGKMSGSCSKVVLDAVVRSPTIDVLNQLAEVVHMRINGYCCFVLRPPFPAVKWQSN